MPKDATKNIDRYKIRGGQLNEFEYTENQKALAERKPKGDEKLIPGTPPEEAVDGLRPVVATIKATKSTKSKKSTKSVKKAKKSSTKSTKKAKTSPTRGATAKKLAARKTAARKK